MPAGRSGAVSRRVCLRLPGRWGDRRAGSRFRWRKIRPGTRLELEAVDQSAAAAWAASDESKDLVRRSSDGRRRAWIVAATDEVGARAPAPRPTAFDRGERDGGPRTNALLSAGRSAAAH